MWFGLPNDAVVGAVEISSETNHRCDLRATHIRREILRFDRLSSACATKILCFIAVESNWNRTTTILSGHRETRRNICIWIVCVDLARVAPGDDFHDFKVQRGKITGALGNLSKRSCAPRNSRAYPHCYRQVWHETMRDNPFVESEFESGPACQQATRFQDKN